MTGPTKKKQNNPVKAGSTKKKLRIPRGPAKLQTKMSNLGFDTIPKSGKDHNQLNRLGVSQDGFDWLVQAMDPFHDFARRVEGLPDLDCSLTVTEKVSFLTDVVAPVAAKWDCHVYSLPFIGVTALQNGGFAAGHPDHILSTAAAVMGATAATMSANIMNITTASSGQSLFPDSAIWNPLNYTHYTAGAGVDVEALVNGNGRVIAAGYEIINTTPELYKSGTITCYKLPSHYTDASFKVSSTVANKLYEGNISTKVGFSLPSTAAEAARLVGTEQWEAKEGAYVVMPMNSMNNSLGVGENTALVLQNEQVRDNKWCIVEQLGGDVAKVLPECTHKKFIPFDCTGVFLTGLSPETTLQIRTVLVIEKAPSHYEEIARFATVSPMYDPVAFQAYSAIVRSCPPGTPVKNNWGGAWFKMLIERLSKFVRPISSVFGASHITDRIAKGAHEVVGGASQLFPFIP